MKNKMTVKQRLALALLIFGGTTVVATILAACKDKPDEPKQLTGNVNINGIMEIGEEVTANIANSNGTDGKFTYQWTRTQDGGQVLEITDANGERYTITEADVDHTLGAIIGNEDTLGTISGTAASKVSQPIIEPITYTHTIVFKDGDLTFDVVYKALPDAPAPAYLDYIEGQLVTFMNSTSSPNLAAVDLLLTKGDRFNITIEYAGDSYTSMHWDVASQSFKIHNDWISTASGPDLQNAVIRDAFNSVVIAMHNAHDAVRLAKAQVPQYNRAMQLRDNRIVAQVYQLPANAGTAKPCG